MRYIIHIQVIFCYWKCTFQYVLVTRWWENSEKLHSFPFILWLVSAYSKFLAKQWVPKWLPFSICLCYPMLLRDILPSRAICSPVSTKFRASSSLTGDWLSNFICICFSSCKTEMILIPVSRELCCTFNENTNTRHSICTVTPSALFLLLPTQDSTWYLLITWIKASCKDNRKVFTGTSDTRILDTDFSSTLKISKDRINIYWELGCDVRKRTNFKLSNWKPQQMKNAMDRGGGSPQLAERLTSMQQGSGQRCIN